MIGIEIKKAIHSKNVRISFTIGIVLAVCQTIYFRFFYYPGYMNNFLGSLEEGKTAGYVQPPVISQGYLGMDFTSFWEHFFYLILPLLAVIPWADSYYCEKRNGYLKIIYSKVSRGKYLLAKFISVFLFGAAAVAIPLLLSLYLSALYLPAKPIDAVMFQSGVNNLTLWGNVFFINPVNYMVRYMVLDALYGGLFAVFSLFLSFFMKKRFSIWTFLFLINLVGYYILSRYISGIAQYVPYFLLNAEAGARVDGRFLLIAGLAVLGISFVGFMSLGKKDEIF